MPRSKFAIPCFWAILFCAEGYAQEEDFLQLSLSELFAVKVEVADRQANSVASAPAATTVIKQDEIKRLGISRLEDLLNWVAGAQSYRSGLDSVVAFRGRAAVNNNDILVMLDGVRLNDPITGNPFAGFSYLPVDLIDRIEVIRGPGSSLYGSNAVNGIVNIISKRDGHHVHAELGQFQHRAAAASLNWQQADWQLSLQFTDRSDEGDDYDAFFEFFGELDPTQDPESEQHAQLFARYKNFSLQLGNYQTRREDFAWSSQGDGINHLDMDSDYYQLNYQFINTETLALDASLSGMESTQSALIVQFPASFAAENWWANGAEEPFIGGNYRENQYRQAALHGSWFQNESVNWQLGAEYRKDEGDTIDFQGNWDAQVNFESNGFIFVPSAKGEITRGLYWFGAYQPLVPATERRVTGYYLQRQQRWQQGHQLTLGLRHDDYEEVGEQLSFRGAYTYRLNDTQSFKLLYGEAFRAPTLFETDALIATGLIGNPELQPETIKTLDLVWQQKWHQWQGAFTVYHSKIDDVIKEVPVEDVVSGFNSLQAQNAGTDQLGGIELELAGPLTENWTFKSSISHAIHRSELGVSDDLVSLSFNYQQAAWNFNLSAYHRSEVLSRDGHSSPEQKTTLDAYQLINAKFTYQLAKKWQGYLKVSNLLDESYVTYSPYAGQPDGSPARGRQFIVGINWDFLP